MHVIDAIMRRGFESKEKLLLQENTGFLKASRIITHAMLPRFFLCCLETPKPDAEIDVVFGFLLKVGYTLLSLVMACTLRLHTFV